MKQSSQCHCELCFHSYPYTCFSSLGESVCYTDNQAECEFPFYFEGITWTGCTTALEPIDNPRPWCVTQTNESGYPIVDENNDVFWGYCHGSCPIDQGFELLL